MKRYFEVKELEDMAKKLYRKEREIHRLDGWFLAKELYENSMQENKEDVHVIATAKALYKVIINIPLYIDEDNIFVGTQRDAFAKSYALINPNFKISTFNGYCDPTEVFNDIEENDTFTRERIENVREKTKNGEYVKSLTRIYESAKNDTQEVAYFIEQVTGHLIPDFRTVIRYGVLYMQSEILNRINNEELEAKKNQYIAMHQTLDSVLILAKRYCKIAQAELEKCEGKRKQQLQLIVKTLSNVPVNGANSLYEAVQFFILLWQVMCMEQAPNPFAFSVGNADRIFEPYRKKSNLSREYTAGLLKHFLVFFNVGDRSWAISQNIMIGGKDKKGNDLTSITSFAFFDAYYAMNLPQPILSVKLHKNTPDRLYQELGKFFFTPGTLTPSLFNDDSMFEVLKRHGIEEEDLEDYSIAGCQEPLIMGKDNGNTTNSWLNLAKILELTLNNGKSLLTGKKIGASYQELNIKDEKELLENIREVYYKNVEIFVDRMVEYANSVTQVLSFLEIPFLSIFMGGIESGIDIRDTKSQGTKYNGSGCLIHGVSVVAESFIAIDELLHVRSNDCEYLIEALKDNFTKEQELHQFLLNCEKFGNNKDKVDIETANVAKRIATIIRSKKNYLGNSFRPDFSTPSTHLIYGSLVGALPNGRKGKEMLNYGIDPLYGEAQNGLGFRVLSTHKLPYEEFNGGYASHLGLDPNYFKAKTNEEKGMEFKNKIITPLFYSCDNEKIAPFYLYVNITTPETLRKVLREPKKYAPSGTYIMRIHGTFVNFLDLSPEIQEDIIKRLDLESTKY